MTRLVPRPRVLVGAASCLTAGTILVGVVAAGHPAHATGPHDVVRYPSVARMAERVGCGGTLRPFPPRAPARDAGECVTADGVRVQFRIFDDMGEARGWGSAMDESDTGRPDPGAYGANWVARVVDATRDEANAVLSRLS